MRLQGACLQASQGTLARFLSKTACCIQEWNAVTKQPALWSSLDLHNCQQASAVLAKLPQQYTGPLKARPNVSFHVQSGPSLNTLT